jgi:hypothetical protein
MTIRKLILLLTVFSLLNSGTAAVAAADEPKKPKPPCRLQISDAHLSTSLLEKQGLRAVKVNASSICNVPQSNVTITVEIWKKGLLENHLVSRKTTKSLGTTYPGSKVDNFSTYQPCTNRTPTTYYGIAYSKALIAGKWQYARHTRSKILSPLKCGT